MNLILKSDSIPTNLKKEIIVKLDDLIGNQESRWIYNNPDEDVALYLYYRYKFKYFPKQGKFEAFPLYLLN